MISRRELIIGAGLLAAPAVIRTPGLLMPVRNHYSYYNGFMNFGHDRGHPIGMIWVDDAWAWVNFTAVHAIDHVEPIGQPGRVWHAVRMKVIKREVKRRIRSTFVGPHVIEPELWLRSGAR